jgi:hypothetical protein
MAKTDLNAQRLRELLDYDPGTGVFVWRMKKARASAGDVAGFSTSHGYFAIKVDGHRCYAHRLAWLYVYGEWPVDHVDHINGNGEDNRICNLRDVPRTINAQNMRRAHADSRHSKLLGVSSSHSLKNPWAAHISINGKLRHLGHYPTQELAHAAYLDAKRAHHPGCTL